MISRACSSVTPFFLRNSAYCAANWSLSSLVRGLSAVAAEMSPPSSAARERIWASSPTMVRSATPRWSNRPAA